jgi:hypothetical protein
MKNLVSSSMVAAAILFLTACASTSAPPAVGAWDVNINTPVGAQAGVWTLNADGTGIMGSDQGDQAIDGITYDGNSVVFSVDIDAGGQSMSLSFDGMAMGDTISGEFSSDFGAFDVTGTRR